MAPSQKQNVDGSSNGPKPGIKIDMSFKKRPGASRMLGQLKDHAIVARWSGLEVARSRLYVVIDGTFVFPPQDVNLDCLTRATVADGWLRKEVRKQHNPIGAADYYDIVVHGQDGGVLRRNRAAAWTYPVSRCCDNIGTTCKCSPQLTRLALQNAKGQWKVIQNFWCFWKGVKYQLVQAEDQPAP